MNKKYDEIIASKIKEVQSRAAKYRDWIKLDARWLTSSMNYVMVSEEREVFVKLILLAAVQGPVPGLISDNDFKPLPHDFIAHRCFCPIEVLESALEKCKNEDSIYENSHGIFITHFDEYQFTEYDRQKQYRNRGKQPFKTPSKEDYANQERNELFQR